MGNNEEAHEEGGSLAEPCCSRESLLTFKDAKKYVMDVRSWKSLGLRCLASLSYKLGSWPWGLFLLVLEG